MVSGADSAKKIKVHSCFFLKKVILIKNQKNNSDLDMISLFLLNMLLLAGKSAKSTAAGKLAMDQHPTHSYSCLLHGKEINQI